MAETPQPVELRTKFRLPVAALSRFNKILRWSRQIGQTPYRFRRYWPTYKLPKGITLKDSNGRLLFYPHVAKFEHVNPQTGLYNCRPQDIAELIDTWWHWIPVKPMSRGKVVKKDVQFAMQVNRECAESMWKRGLRPADMIRFIIDLKYDKSYEWLLKKIETKGMAFVWACEEAFNWAMKQGDDHWCGFHPECPRSTPRRPGEAMSYGDLFDPQHSYIDIPPRLIEASVYQKATQL